MTISLSMETEKRLLAEAARRGIQADQLATELIDAALQKPTELTSNQSSIDILNEWEAATATDDSTELVRRREEFEAFKRELNQTRVASDGPDARVPYP
jgi:hypothetical protein